MSADQNKKFTREQIEARLKALDQYEMSLRFMPDEGDLTTREMLRIVTARSKLRQMLTESANVNTKEG